MPSPRTAPVRPLAALLSIGFAAGCYAPRVDVMPRGLLVEFDGNYSSNDGSLPAGTNDLDAFGLEDDPVLFTPRVDVSSGRWDWTADWIGNDFDGRGTLTSGLVIDGVSFPAGNDVAADLELNVVRLGATWDLVREPETTVGLGAGLGIYQADAFLLDLDTGASSETDQNGLAPHLMARLGREFGEVDVQLLAGWIDFQINDVDTAYLDLDTFVRWRFRGRDEGWSAALLAGYRYVDVDLSYNEEDLDEDVDWKTALRGPYVGFSLGF